MSTVADQPCFCWMRGLRGLERQKWSRRPPHKGGGIDAYWDDKIVTIHPITQEQFDNLTLDQLEGLFPRPGARAA